LTSARTILVDDHPLFRLGLRVLLRGHEEVELVGEAATADEAIDLAGRCQIDIALVDLVLPGGGVALAARLREVQPACKILGLSVIDEPARIAEMLLAGASGYVFKSQPLAEIVEAIRLVLGGIRYLPPGVSSDAVDTAAMTGVRSFDRLTRREREVFEQLIRGRSNGAIASSLLISIRTVETHRQRILDKLEAHSIVELVHLATLHGFE
jgi:DNA-binding NarL/FixJ family response regulator